MIGDNMDAINIRGSSQTKLVLAAATANKSPALAAGRYDVWCSADAFIRVAPLRQGATMTASPNRAEDVTVDNGYQIYANNVVPVMVQEGDVIGAISTPGGNFFYQKTG